MEVIGLIKLGTPFILLGILYYLAQLTPIIKNIKSDIGEIKEGMVWEKTCDAHRDALDGRIKALERAGKGGK